MAATAGTADRVRARVCAGEEGERAEAWLGEGASFTTCGKGRVRREEEQGASTRRRQRHGRHRRRTVATGKGDFCENPLGTFLFNYSKVQQPL